MWYNLLMELARLLMFGHPVDSHAVLSVRPAVAETAANTGAPGAVEAADVKGLGARGRCVAHGSCLLPSRRKPGEVC